jgi:cytochrome c peroxidase
MRSMLTKSATLCATALCIATALAMFAGTGVAAATDEALASLGQALFFDVNLSALRNQSCASCHDPGRAFSDSRDNGVAGAASLGDDGVSLGDRNTPATTYAFLVPEFQRNAQGEYVGGFFLDGRAATMADQAAEPFVNPLEMALPDHGAVVDRVRENAAYVRLFESNFGADVFADDERALRAITASIVAFERTALFAPFDSKYDRFLRGEYSLTTDEELGRVLFFSQLVNCSNCHLLDTREFSAREVFSNHRYHNIGVQTNDDLRSRNGVGKSYRDPGLAGNPAVDDPAMAGKFRVPSLRNVAVTSPYMHNGVFRELRTAILFYNRFTLGNWQSQTNPETGTLWGEAEFAETVDLDLLRNGQPLAENHVVALEAFLQTLTDRRYEALLGQDR